jgi:hypothetical protein
MLRHVNVFPAHPLSDIHSGALFVGLEPVPSAAELRSLARFDHGGLLETSLMLHLHADRVRPEYRSLAPRGRIAYLGLRGRVPDHFQGYVGQPAAARADIGAAVVAALATAAADLVERAVDGQRARHARHARHTRSAATGALPRRVASLAVLGALGFTGTGVALVRRWLPYRWPRWPGVPRR